ncbi:hypothetical protein MSG28_004577 [Choristoneura fumiferana]|uniref:Uncharacterized protein n=1 Tax=Choristoneura fumiferana TaxID=7141 RepID=A0ACC0K6M3_CHOFU|nr:hypothetical protein MSG28_004577 [Choristoneura fumiferana]
MFTPSPAAHGCSNTRMGENITLSELWTDSPCNKEITLSEATNDIQLRAHSIRITQVKIPFTKLPIQKLAYGTAVLDHNYIQRSHTA